jgi:hypothetical protein
MTWFCPEDFEPDEKSMKFARSKGLTEAQIEDQVDAMKDYEFQRKRTEWQRVFRNWIRSGVEWGKIVPVRKRRMPEEVSEEQRKADAAKAWAELNRLKAVNR